MKKELFILKKNKKNLFKMNYIGNFLKPRDLRFIPFIFSLATLFLAGYFFYSIQVKDGGIIKRNSSEDHFKGDNFNVVILCTIYILVAGLCAGNFLAHNLQLVISITLLVFYCLLYINSTNYDMETEGLVIILALICISIGKGSKDLVKYDKKIIIPLLILGVILSIVLYAFIEDYKTNLGNEKEINRHLMEEEKAILFINLSIFIILIVDTYVTKYT